MPTCDASRRTSGVTRSAVTSATANAPSAFEHLERHDADAGFAQQIGRDRIRILRIKDDFLHARTDQQLGAIHAWLMRAVRRCISDADAVQRALHDRIRLGMSRALTVIVHQQTPDVGTMRHTAWRAVVSGSENAPVARQHAADRCTRTRRTRRHGLRDLHEILVPPGSHNVLISQSLE
jgi:hypothetical protein